MAHPFKTTHEHTTVSLILAGGRGSRLAPLTDARSKPATPFAGTHRLIDIALSNLANSGLRDVWVAEQYRPFTLNQHLAGGRPWDLDGTSHGLRILPPTQAGESSGFAEGNGHALYQQIPTLKAFGADTIIVLSADHLYHLDLRPVLTQHHERNSDLTVVTTQLNQDVSRYGVVQTKADGTVTDYNYKPSNPRGNLIATEVFIFNIDTLEKVTNQLIQQLSQHQDPEDPQGASLGDYGESILPYFVRNHTVHEYRLDGYWRDIGTIDAYYQAHMDLITGGGLPLNQPGWEIRTNPGGSHTPARIGPNAHLTASLIAPGATVMGTVDQSIIGPGVTVQPGAHVSRSILLGNTTVPAGAHLESVIADVAAPIPSGVTGATKPGPGNITVLTAPDATRHGNSDTLPEN